MNRWPLVGPLVDCAGWDMMTAAPAAAMAALLNGSKPTEPADVFTQGWNNRGKHHAKRR